MSKYRILLPLLGAWGLTACTVGPDYVRPTMTLPDHYNAAASGASPVSTDAQQTVQRDWWRLFDDVTLNELVALALANNADLQMAVARIAQAQGLAMQAGAAQYPSLSLNASGTRAAKGPAASGTGLTYMDNNFVGNAGLAYELDIWGQVRRSVESADAQVKASVFDRDAVQLVLEGSVVRAYINLRSLDAQIKVTEDSIHTRRESLRIVQARFAGGLVSPLDINQAEAALASLQATQAELVRQRAVAQNQLGVLTGKLDLSIASADVTALPIPPAPPAGMPSELLEARPDVRKAEEQLVSANAQIGVAKANFFPSFSLTGMYGAQSVGFSNFLGANGSIWAATLGLMQPLFTGGALTGALDTAKGKQQEALANYVKTVRAAFGEVSDALASVQQTREAEGYLRAQVKASGKAQQIAIVRYQNGYADYLYVLESQRVANEANLVYVRNRAARLLAGVDLFKALGGGWQVEKALP